MNYGIMIAVGLVVICFIAMVVSHNVSKEGFDVSQYVTRANDNDPVFSQTMPNGVYTNMGLNLDLASLNKALDQPDLYQTTSPSTDYSPLFQEDPEGLFKTQDEQFCQGATSPRNLPNRGLSRVGCGWVYFIDPATPGRGSIGTSKGPIFGMGSVGQWIWDLQLAAKMEDIKQCRKLTACGNVDGNDFTNVCGFCPDTGHGVPINSQGTQVYPDDTTGGSCASTPVRTASQCPVPSTDAGDSLPVGGGSGESSGDPNVCAVNSNGAISSACIIRQAQQAGMSVGGAYILRVNNPQSPNSETETEAIQILNQAGYRLPQSPYKLDPITALNQCSAVVKAQVSGSNSQIRAAAALLSAGVAFNLCDIDPSTTGPFKPACMQQEFRKAGCQPAGVEFPATADKASAASLGKTMAQVRSAYSTLFGNMSSSNGTVADKAVKDCLGIKVSRPAGSSCDSAWIANATKESFVGTAVEGFASQQQTFLLQSHNYPSHLMRSLGAGAQAAMVVGRGTGSLFILAPGATPGTIQLQPQALPGTSLSPVSTQAVNTMSEAPSAMNSFRVVPGLADNNKVSFQLVADPTKYIRHAGFVLWAHKNDGSPLYGADATFQPLDINSHAIQLQLPAVSMFGWKGVAIDNAKTISVGTDNAIWYSRNGSTGMINGAAAQMKDSSAPFKLMVDGASASKAVSVGNDGVLYELDAAKRWSRVKTIGPAIVNASISADGTIAYLNNSNEIFRGSSGNFKKLPGSAYSISLGKTGNDIYVVGTDYTVYIWREGRNTGNDSWENIANPPNVRFRQIVVSKDGFKVATMSSDGKLYGLDVFNKWSQIPNPVDVAYVGLNKNKLVGTTGYLTYEKSLETKEGFATSQEANPSGFIKSLGKYPQSDINIGCFTNKGIEQTKAECKNNSDCAGFSYAKNGSSGCFKKGPLSGTQTDPLFDGFAKDPMPAFNPRASLPSSFTPSKGAIIGNIKVAENYRLSFNVTPKGLVGNWSSILHFNGTGRDCCGAGDRSPAIFFFPGALTLHVRIGDMNDGNWGVDLNGCMIGRTSKVVLECRNSVVKVMVDSSSSTLIQPSKRASGPANVYCGDPWYPAANAQIENLMYEYL